MILDPNKRELSLAELIEKARETKTYIEPEFNKSDNEKGCVMRLFLIMMIMICIYLFATVVLMDKAEQITSIINHTLNNN
jgi:hypothetical protein